LKYIFFSFNQIIFINNKILTFCMLRAKRSRRTLKVKYYLKKRRTTKKIGKKRRATKKIKRKTKMTKKRSLQTKSKKKNDINVQFGGDDEKDYLRKDLVRFQNLKSVPEIETRKFSRLLKTVSTNFTNYSKTFFPSNPVIPIPTIIKEWLEQSKIFLKEYYYTYDKDGNKIFDDDGTLKSPCFDEVNLAKGASDKENKKVCEDLKEYRDSETDFYKSPIRALRVKISGILKYLSTTLPKSLGSPLGDLPVRKKTEVSAVSAPAVSATAVSAGPPPKNVIGTAASAVLVPTTRVLTVDPPLKKEPEKPVVVDSDPVLPDELAPEEKSTFVDFSKTNLGTSLPVIESTLPPRETEPIESNPTLDAKKTLPEPTPTPPPTPKPLKKPPRPPLPKPKPEPTTVTTVIPSTAARATVTRPETTVTSTTVTSTAPPTKTTVTSTPPPTKSTVSTPPPPQRQAPAPAQRQAPAPAQTQPQPQKAQPQKTPAQNAPAQKAQPQKTPAQNAPAQNAPAQNAPAQNAPQSSTQKAAQKKGPTQKKVNNPCDIPNSATWFMGANGILYPYMFDRAWTV
jgi:hypothetical protein